MTADKPLTNPAFERAAFGRLPPHAGRRGDARRVGVEIEFGGLTQDRVASVVQQIFGGRAERHEGGDIRVEQTALGLLQIYLDTALRKEISGPVARAGLELSRAVVPVELVTEPLAQTTLPVLDRLRERLRDAGAVGTRDGILLGFGVHLNIEIADADGADVPAVCLAYALLEDWLRETDPMDISRRLLPFTDRYRRFFVDALARNWPDLSPARFFELYAEYNSSRNRGLDLMPVFRHCAPERFAARYGAANSVSARPAYHFRLPDSRIDEPDWSLAYEWNRWAFVEEVSRDGALLEALVQGWRQTRADWPLPREHWPHEAARILERAGRYPGAVS